MSPADIQLINQRLEHHKARKTELLKMKKSQRGSRLQEVETKIRTLKRWLLE